MSVESSKNKKKQKKQKKQKKNAVTVVEVTNKDYTNFLINTFNSLVLMLQK